MRSNTVPSARATLAKCPRGVPSNAGFTSTLRISPVFTALGVPALRVRVDGLPVSVFHRVTLPFASATSTAPAGKFNRTGQPRALRLERMPEFLFAGILFRTHFRCQFINLREEAGLRRVLHERFGPVARPIRGSRGNRIFARAAAPGDRIRWTFSSLCDRAPASPCTAAVPSARSRRARAAIGSTASPPTVNTSWISLEASGHGHCLLHSFLWQHRRERAAAGPRANGCGCPSAAPSLAELPAQSSEKSLRIAPKRTAAIPRACTVAYASM